MPKDCRPPHHGPAAPRTVHTRLRGMFAWCTYVTQGWPKMMEHNGLLCETTTSSNVTAASRLVYPAVPPSTTLRLVCECLEGPQLRTCELCGCDVSHQAAFFTNQRPAYALWRCFSQKSSNMDKSSPPAQVALASSGFSFTSGHQNWWPDVVKFGPSAGGPSEIYSISKWSKELYRWST